MADDNKIIFQFGYDPSSLTKLRQDISSKLKDFNISLSDKSVNDIKSKLNSISPNIKFGVDLRSIKSISQTISKSIDVIPIKVKADGANLSSVKNQIQNNLGKFNLDIKLNLAGSRLESLDKNLNSIRNSFETASAAKDAFAENVKSKFPTIIASFNNLREAALSALNQIKELKSVDIRSASVTKKSNLEKQTNSGNETIGAIDKNDKLSESADKVEKSITEVGRAHRNASNQIANFSERIGFSTARLAAYLIPAVGIYRLIDTFQSAKSSIIETNTEIIKLSQVLGGSVEKASSLADAVFDIGVKYGRSGKELLDITNSLARINRGVGSNNEIENTIKIFAKTNLAVGFGTLEETVRGTNATLFQFNKTGKDTGEVLDEISSLTKNFKVNADDLFTAVEAGGGAFSQAGGDLKEYLAIVAAAKNITQLPASTVGNALNSISFRLQQPEIISFVDRLTNGKVRNADGSLKSLGERIKEIANATKGLDTIDIANIAEKLAGPRQGKILAPLLKDIAKGREGLSEFSRAVETVNKSPGELSRDASQGLKRLDIQLESVSARFAEVFKNLEENKGIQHLVEEFAILAKGIAEVVDKIGPLIPTLIRFAGIKLAVSAASSIPGIISGFNRGRNEANGRGLLGSPFISGVGGAIGFGSGGIGSTLFGGTLPITSNKLIENEIKKVQEGGALQVQNSIIDQVNQAAQKRLEQSRPRQNLAALDAIRNKVILSNEVQTGDIAQSFPTGLSSPRLILPQQNEDTNRNFLSYLGVAGGSNIGAAAQNEKRIKDTIARQRALARASAGVLGGFSSEEVRQLGPQPKNIPLPIYDPPRVTNLGGFSSEDTRRLGLRNINLPTYNRTFQGNNVSGVPSAFTVIANGQSQALGNASLADALRIGGPLQSASKRPQSRISRELFRDLGPSRSFSLGTPLQDRVADLSVDRRIIENTIKVNEQKYFTLSKQRNEITEQEIQEKKRLYFAVKEDRLTLEKIASEEKVLLRELANSQALSSPLGAGPQTLKGKLLGSQGLLTRNGTIAKNLPGLAKRAGAGFVNNGGLDIVNFLIASGFDIRANSIENTNPTGADTLRGAGTGFLTGASIGASIGSGIAPGIGTAIGGLAGGLIGAGSGAIIGSNTSTAKIDKIKNAFFNASRANDINQIGAALSHTALGGSKFSTAINSESGEAFQSRIRSLALQSAEDSARSGNPQDVNQIRAKLTSELAKAFQDSGLSIKSSFDKAQKIISGTFEKLPYLAGDINITSNAVKRAANEFIQLSNNLALFSHQFDLFTKIINTKTAISNVNSQSINQSFGAARGNNSLFQISDQIPGIIASRFQSGVNEINPKGNLAGNSVGLLLNNISGGLLQGKTNGENTRDVISDAALIEKATRDTVVEISKSLSGQIIGENNRLKLGNNATNILNKNLGGIVVSQLATETGKNEYRKILSESGELLGKDLTSFQGNPDEVVRKLLGGFNSFDLVVNRTTAEIGSLNQILKESYDSYSREIDVRNAVTEANSQALHTGLKQINRGAALGLNDFDIIERLEKLSNLAQNRAVFNPTDIANKLGLGILKTSDSRNILSKENNELFPNSTTVEKASKDFAEGLNLSNRAQSDYRNSLIKSQDALAILDAHFQQLNKTLDKQENASIRLATTPISERAFAQAQGSIFNGFTSGFFGQGGPLNGIKNARDLSRLSVDSLRGLSSQASSLAGNPAFINSQNEFLKVFGDRQATGAPNGVTNNDRAKIINLLAGLGTPDSTGRTPDREQFINNLQALIKNAESSRNIEDRQLDALNEINATLIQGFHLDGKVDQAEGLGKTIKYYFDGILNNIPKFNDNKNTQTTVSTNSPPSPIRTNEQINQDARSDVRYGKSTIAELHSHLVSGKEATESLSYAINEYIKNLKELKSSAANIKFDGNLNIVGLDFSSKDIAVAGVVIGVLQNFANQLTNSNQAEADLKSKLNNAIKQLQSSYNKNK